MKYYIKQKINQNTNIHIHHHTYNMQKSIQKLQEITAHDNIILTNRGNTAIRLALKYVKELNKDNDKRMIFIQDQGGWMSYHKYTEKLKLQKFDLQTTFGVLKPYQLEKSLKKYNNFAAIIYQNPAGYYADQPYKEIYEICKKYNIVCILDVTGCIGLDKFGNYADILVCSFGESKPIDLGYGGFISFKEAKAAEQCNYKLEEQDKELNAKIIKNLPDKIDKLGTRYGKLFTEVHKVKTDLAKFKILHKDKKGINVVVMFRNDKEKQKIIDYCKKNKYEFTECPRYIRVNTKAISIEVKRIKTD